MSSSRDDWQRNQSPDTESRREQQEREKREQDEKEKKERERRHTEIRGKPRITIGSVSLAMTPQAVIARSGAAMQSGSVNENRGCR
jgi:hypothetical protein